MKGAHTGSLPLNARVTVDYKKGDVSFSYPRKRSKRRAKLSALLGLYLYFLMTWVILIFVISLAVISIEYAGTVKVGGGLSPAELLSGLLNTLRSLIILSVPPLIPALVVVLKSGWLKKYFPKISAFYSQIISGKYEALFHKTEDRKIEIPLFKNVLLDYEATGDFSKNLERIEIKEHPFTIIRGKKRQSNDYLWRAVFYFSEECRKGYLKVFFI